MVINYSSSVFYSLSEKLYSKIEKTLDDELLKYMIKNIIIKERFDDLDETTKLKFKNKILLYHDHNFIIKYIFKHNKSLYNYLMI